MTHYEMDDLRNKKKFASASVDEVLAPPALSQDSTQQIWALSVAGMSVIFIVLNSCRH
jgi:hypothetical protein